MGKCIICDKETGRNKYCCSRECYNKFRSHYKVCPICGCTFQAPPSSDQKTCGEKKCSATYRSSLEYSKNTIKIARASAESILGPYETNINAKFWCIRSPEGDKYEFRNLQLWAREHSEIIPGTVAQFTDGIRAIKRSRLTHYKGWTLLFYDG